MALGVLYLDGSRCGNQPYYDGVSEQLLEETQAVADVILSWTNELCSGDTEERALVLAVVNDFLPLMNIWLPLIIWQQVDAPRYHTGFITASCLIVVGFFLVLGVLYLTRRDEKRYAFH